MINIEAFYKISYGLYIVCSGTAAKGNGYVANTVFQVSANPPLLAISCSKDNYSINFIKEGAAFSVSVLQKEASREVLGRFGYKSGKDFDKLVESKVIYGSTGVPIVLDDSVAWFECKVNNSIDVGTHIIFIGEIIHSDMLDAEKEPITYEYYRRVKKGLAPKNAPTYIEKTKAKAEEKTGKAKKFKCLVCGYIYDDAVESIRFEDLPNDWTCPVCGAEKSDFTEI